VFLTNMLNHTFLYQLSSLVVLVYSMEIIEISVEFRNCYYRLIITQHEHRTRTNNTLHFLFFRVLIKILSFTLTYL